MKRRAHFQLDHSLRNAASTVQLARSTASVLPAITTWFGELIFATRTNLTCLASAQASFNVAQARRQSLPPSRRCRPAQLPACSGHARALFAPRQQADNAPAATSAEYSPKLCPATNAGASIPSASIARNAATETVRIAGCVFSVNCKSSAGPSKQSREIGKAQAHHQLLQRPVAAAGKFSARSFPIPGFCEP